MNISYQDLDKMKGALHTLDDGTVRVSFNQIAIEQRACQTIAVFSYGGVEVFRLSDLGSMQNGETLTLAGFEGHTTVKLEMT